IGWPNDSKDRLLLAELLKWIPFSPSEFYLETNLYDGSGCVLPVMEAKRTARDPREGEEQLRNYVTEIARNQPFAPFGFMANGLRTALWRVLASTSTYDFPSI